MVKLKSIVALSVLLSLPVSAADMSGWSDKTVCRLVEQHGKAEYIDEAKSRGLGCVGETNQEIVSVNPNRVAKALAGIDIENDPNKEFIPVTRARGKAAQYWGHALWQQHDFNNDGHVDTLFYGAMNPGTWRVRPAMFFGDGTGEPSNEVTKDYIVDKKGIEGGRQLLVADYNSDGRLDFYIADTGDSVRGRNKKNDGSEHRGQKDNYYLSQPDGTWLESHATHLSHPDFMVFNHGAATGDIDNDGDMDIVYTELRFQHYERGTAFWCLYNDGTGFMTKKKCGGQFGFGLELADMDGDGDLDALIGGGEHNGNGLNFTGVVWNDGNGKFKRKTALPRHSKYWHGIPEISASDLDNDGDMDVVLSRHGMNYVGTAIQIVENLGSKKFKDHGLIALVKAPKDKVKALEAGWEGNNWNDFIESIMFRDVDEDGNMDIYLSAGDRPRTDGHVLLNDGDWGFTKAKFLWTRNGPLLLHKEKMEFEFNSKNYE